MIYFKLVEDNISMLEIFLCPAQLVHSLYVQDYTWLCVGEHLYTCQVEYTALKSMFKLVLSIGHHCYLKMRFHQGPFCSMLSLFFEKIFTDCVVFSRFNINHATVKSRCSFIFKFHGTGANINLHAFLPFFILFVALSFLP